MPIDWYENRRFSENRRVHSKARREDREINVCVAVHFNCRCSLPTRVRTPGPFSMIGSQWWVCFSLVLFRWSIDSLLWLTIFISFFCWTSFCIPFRMSLVLHDHWGPCWLGPRQQRPVQSKKAEGCFMANYKSIWSIAYDLMYRTWYRGLEYKDRADAAHLMDSQPKAK